MEILPNYIIRAWIFPCLTQPQLERPNLVDRVELLEAILYRLRTGYQWRCLPVK